MAYGYLGKILLVDLGAGKIEEKAVPDVVYEEYLSGIGLAAYYLYRMIPAGADALGSENVLCFVSGLLTGTGSLFTGRWTAAAKSPLTGTWGDANGGGFFSPAIKRCGYDGIFFTGISEKPVYLYANGDTAELRDAGHLWGKDAVEAEEMLIAENSPTLRAAVIGKAGEKLSLISGICTDRGRIAARSGLGAVMGSKRLKAVALDGKKLIIVHDAVGIKNLSKKCGKNVPSEFPLPGRVVALLGVAMRILPIAMRTDGKLVLSLSRKWGTVSLNQASIAWGDSPIKNWLGSNEDFDLERSAPFNPDEINKCEKSKYRCYSCPLGCGGICALEGKYKETHKPEYETMLSLGGLCMNTDVDSIFYLNELLNRAGMDSISAGATVAFAMECWENGVLTKEDTGGIELSWGNADAMKAVIEKMIAREGIGDILADGSRAAADKIGRAKPGIDEEIHRHLVHAGGQELPMHDGRNDPGFALHYSVEPTPGRHTIGSLTYYEMWQLWESFAGLPKPPMFYQKNSRFKSAAEKAVVAAANSKFINVINGSGLCLFGSFLGIKRMPIFAWLNAATGWHKSPEEYLKIGERIQTLKQAFNVKQHIEPVTLRISDRALGRPPLLSGANKGRSVDIEDLTSEYWAQFGWDENGKPTEETMEKLGITA
jgi:aldehyde:ferredoxin oxidoreductase